MKADVRKVVGRQGQAVQQGGRHGYRAPSGAAQLLTASRCRLGATPGASVRQGIDLTGEVAVVTGGYSGIGPATTRVLRAAGAAGVVPARDVAGARVGPKGVCGPVPCTLAPSSAPASPGTASRRPSGLPVPATTAVSRCATGPQLDGLGGAYCENRDISPLDHRRRGRAVLRGGLPGVLPYAVVPEAAARLWEVSERPTA